jgi:hypothetical protein
LSTRTSCLVDITSTDLERINHLGMTVIIILRRTTTVTLHRMSTTLQDIMAGIAEGMMAATAQGIAMETAVAMLGTAVAQAEDKMAVMVAAAVEMEADVDAIEFLRHTCLTQGCVPCICCSRALQINGYCLTLRHRVAFKVRSQ